jgi:NAD(P)-dependent dehydrogenase (short-subunit alcohol dehydrogenase family)
MQGFVSDVAVAADAARTVARAASFGQSRCTRQQRWGWCPVCALIDANFERASAIYAVNVIGRTLLAAAAIPHLEQSRGAIVNVSSTLARKTTVGFADYAASKAALEQATRCWALQLARKRVRVNAVASGPVESELLRVRMGFSERGGFFYSCHEERRLYISVRLGER